MYIRKKSIKNKKTGAIYNYAYVVENTWRKKGARQKVKHYLGKIYVVPLVHDIDFFSHWKVLEEQKDIFFKEYTTKQLIHKLVEWELIRHGVQDFFVDLKRAVVSKDRKPATLEIGEGMLNSYTLKQLLFFIAEGDQEQDGYRLAKAFVEAGIQVPQEVFVALFTKIMEQGKV